MVICWWRRSNQVQHIRKSISALLEDLDRSQASQNNHTVLTHLMAAVLHSLKGVLDHHPIPPNTIQYQPVYKKYNKNTIEWSQFFVFRFWVHTQDFWTIDRWLWSIIGTCVSSISYFSHTAHAPPTVIGHLSFLELPFLRLDAQIFESIGFEGCLSIVSVSVGH